MMETHIIPMHVVVDAVSVPFLARVYTHEGNYYVFSDTQIGDRKTRCQYGVLDKDKSDLSVIWTDCEDGALFTQVQPFAAIDKEYRLTGKKPDSVRIFMGEA
jgi:hypothetical protein